MNEITIITDRDNIEYVIIDRGNNEFTSMLKETWDAMQESANQI